MNPQITCTVMYFGRLADLRGLAEEIVSTTAETTGELYQELARIHRLELPPAGLRVAANDEFATWDHRLQSGDRIALLPPMSGG